MVRETDRIATPAASKRDSPERRVVESVNIIPIIERYSTEERGVLFKNLNSIELTLGCSGGCPDCYLNVSHGVKAKVSHSSLEEFFKRYSNELPNFFHLYYGSDPFDWQEDGKSIVDIYKLYKKYKPSPGVFLSTYFPRGSEEQMYQLIAEMIRNIPKGEKPDDCIRISLRQTTPEKREKELKRLKTRMAPIKGAVIKILGEQYKKEIDDFFQEDNFLRGVCYPPIKYARMLLGKSYPGLEQYQNKTMQSIASFGSSDEVILGLEGFRGVAMDAVTPYNTSGETHWTIESGKNFRAPMLQRERDFISYNRLIAQYKTKGSIALQPLLLPRVKAVTNKEGVFVEGEEFTVSRELLAYKHFLQSFADGFGSTWELKENERAVKYLLQNISAEFDARRTLLVEELQKPITSTEQQYVLNVGKLYLYLMDFLFTFIKHKVADPNFPHRDLLAAISWANNLEDSQIQGMNLEADLSKFLEKSRQKAY